nr:CRISPR-associated helicase Cas3' [uncultured Ilyobacter sp.]
MEEYFSHIKKNNYGEIIFQKKLKDHLEEVEERTKNIFYKNTGFSIQNEEISKIIQIIGKYHDFGKYTEYFQKYLLGETKSSDNTNHANLSGVFSYNHFENVKNERLRYLIYYIIKYHHSKLKSPLNDMLFDFNSNEKYMRLFNTWGKNLLQNKSKIEEEVMINFKENDFILNDKLLRRNAKKIVKESNIENYYLVNYLFSILINSDKIKSSETEIYENNEINLKIVDNFLQKNLSVDEQKNKVRETIKKNILLNRQENLFTITAPTGVGKTLSSLDAAIELREEIFREKGYLPKIIYCLPFINIIDQTVDIFENVFKNENIKIIKHHQYTDIFEKNDSKEKYEVQKLKMQLETWQGDIVVTTFIQFFHTLIGNKNSLLKKFCEYAGSIIILDEIQSINPKYWRLIGAVLYYLGKYLDSKIILMTATQPAIFDNIDKLGIREKINKIELLDDNKKYYSKLERTKLVPCFENKIDSNEFIDLFSREYEVGKSALIVVNTIKRANELFDKIRNMFKSKDEISCFCLSTSLIPKHRKILIKKIKSLLKKNRSVIVISTQCIEAGVDLDFDIGFRDVAPLDSIIQVAGRINRNDDKKKKNSPLYIVHLKNDSSLVYGSVIPKVTKNILENKKEIFEKNYKEIIDNYFFKLNKEIEIDLDASKKIFEAMKNLNYDFKSTEISIEEFRLIDEKNKGEYVNLFVDFYPGENRELSILNRYLETTKISYSEKRKDEQLKIKGKFNNFVITIKKKDISVEIENFKINDWLYYIPYKKRKEYYDDFIGFNFKGEDEIFYSF